MKKLLAETVIEKERRLKKELGEQSEILDATGQESEKKAVRPIQEINKLEDQKAEKKKTDTLTKLDDEKKHVFTYTRHLMQTLHDLVNTISFSKEYSWGVWFDGKAIVLKIIDKQKKSHTRAFISSHSPVHDYNMLLQFYVWAEDVYDVSEGNIQVEKEDGIWLPNGKWSKTKSNIPN